MALSTEIQGPRLAVQLSAVDNRVDVAGGAWLFNRSGYGQTYWCNDSVLSVGECERLVTVGKLLAQHEGITGAGAHADHVRRSQVAWLFPGGATAWIFDRLAPIVAGVNNDLFGLDLYGFTQGMQFTRYEAPGSHYTWHMDYGPKHANRKLSMIVQLSNPDCYEGGEVELFTASEPTVMPKQQGAMILFPSFVMHRVKPVTAGERISLVSWLEGPALR